MRYITVMTTVLASMLAVITPAQSQAADNVDAATCWRNVVPPTNKSQLLNWLNKKSYKENFIAETRIHKSVPHGGKVRTYYNPILAIDLRGKKTLFRKGAAMVKELYADDNKIMGYTVMVKVQQHKNAQQQDWLYYMSGQNAPYGRGVSACAGCHQSGVDYLRSGFRP